MRIADPVVRSFCSYAITGFNWTCQPVFRPVSAPMYGQARPIKAGDGVATEGATGKISDAHRFLEPPMGSEKELLRCFLAISGTFRRGRCFPERSLIGIKKIGDDIRKGVKGYNRQPGTSTSWLVASRMWIVVWFP